MVPSLKGPPLGSSWRAIAGALPRRAILLAGYDTAWGTQNPT